jgi:beta-hydroxylase
MSSEELQQTQRNGVFHGSPVDRTDGYIHLSFVSQVGATLDRHFGGVEDLILVAVDLTRLGDSLRWEPARGGELFPHICGHLPMEAVARSERWNEPQMERSDCRLNGTLQKVYKW